MYGWIFYDVETHDKKTDEFINCVSYTTMDEAVEYIKRMINTKSLDNNEKLVLIEKRYDNNRELRCEIVLEGVDYIAK